jgi:integrase
MASVHKDPRGKSPYWYCSFTLPSGKRAFRSTKQSDRRKAARVCLEWEDAAKQAGQGRLTEGAARKVIQDIYQFASAQALPVSTTEKFFDSWLSSKKAETSVGTFRKYEDVALQFVAHLGERKVYDISRITKAEIASFRDSIGKRLSASTANLALKIIRSAFTQAQRDGYITDNPAMLMKGLKDINTEAKRRAFTLPELERILACANEEWRGMILFGLYTGQRLGDIAKLTWQNLDLQREEVRLTTGKTGRRQIIPLARPLLKFIDFLPTSDDPKFPLFQKAFDTVTRTGLVGTLSNQFYALLSDAGLAAKRTHQKRGKGRSVKRETGELSFHCLRHTATSLLKNAGISSAVVQEFVGHDSNQVSQQYTHIETQALRKAADSLPDLTSKLGGNAQARATAKKAKPAG